MKKTHLAVLTAAVVAVGATVPLVAAQGTPSDKVTICHATASVTNPYTSPEVNTSSVDEVNNKFLDGHGDHTGPVFDPAGGKDQPAWGDIIPPFESPIGTKFPGYNWTEAGQAIYNNGCQPVIPTPTPTPTPTETTPTPTPTLTETPTPTPTVTVTEEPTPTPTVTVTETPEPVDEPEPEPVDPEPVPTEIPGGL